MNFQHVNIKFYVDESVSVDWEQFIKVFHVWVAEQSMDELLIDVADYRHVPMGPGVVLVGHEADYFMDNTANQPGLRYHDKIERSGTNEDRLHRALRAAAIACLRLEAEVDGMRFDRQRFHFRINDRAFAPNTKATYESCQAELPTLLQHILGDGDYKLQYDRDPRSLFGAVVRTPQAIDLDTLAASSVPSA